MKKTTNKYIAKELTFGLIIVSLLFIVAVFAPKIAPYDPDALLDDSLHPPSSAYIFGTDGIGRDVFSRTVYGTRTSLFVGITAAFISMLIGTIVGSLAGYFGGRLDRIIYEILNVFSMVPSLFLIILVIAFFGSNIRNVVLVIGLTSWSGTARIMRAQTKSLKERTFVRAAKLIGKSDFKIIIDHIIPHGISPVLSNAAMSVSGAILSEASLSFIGLGDPSSISWGQLINNGRQYVFSGWWVMTFAGLAIAITVFAFHMIGAGVDKMLNPSKARN
ncbi:ABC transporter permease [Anaerococcus sp. ENR0831]|uniref:ABC transporter permease n=1 Tax=Anaerococcus martiniensis TaxID=3115615 RepID=A0ABW9M8L5_9FIRM